jgi:hypothetical protein
MSGESSISEGYLYDAQGQQVTPRVDVPTEHQNMSRVDARSIMVNAAMRPIKKAQLEAMERRMAKSIVENRNDGNENGDTSMNGT